MRIETLLNEEFSHFFWVFDKRISVVDAIEREWMSSINNFRT